MTLAAYLLLFIAVGAGFIFVHLVAGKFIRPNKPGPEKGTIYECGEPTIGSAWVQFDLRFYVVALLFVIFDVEVAFFFPWAEVFGRANAVAAYEEMPQGPELKEYGRAVAALIPHNAQYARTIRLYESLGEDAGGSEAATPGPHPHLTPADFEANRTAARELAVLALGEIVVFFGVLLVGFAYLWKRGDLEWVRSLAAESQPVAPSATVRPKAIAAATPEPTTVAAGH